MIRALLIGLLAALLTSCASTQDTPRQTAAEALVWPQPPDPPRIKFLYAFQEPKDLGLSRSVFKRLWGLIAGKRQWKMARPYAIAVEGDTIAVADPGVRAVHVFDLARKKYRPIAKAGDEFLESPVGVAIGADRIYLADSGLQKVFIFDSRGRYLSSIPGLARPTGLALDPSTQRLYVADTLKHRIAVFDREGKELFSFGDRGEDTGRFNYPTHLFLKAGMLFVNDTMNFRLQVFDLDGNKLAAFGTHGNSSGHFAQPKGVAVDEEGHIYVADALFNRVQIFDRRGRFLLAFGQLGGNAGNFWLPAGLFVAQDRVYVADSYNERIQVFQFLGGG